MGEGNSHVNSDHQAQTSAYRESTRPATGQFYGDAVQNLSALAAVGEGNRFDKQMRFVEDAGLFYVFDLQAGSGDVAPDTGSGFWLQTPAGVPAPVSSVFGRIGAVSAVLGDYVASQIGNDSAAPGADTKLALDGHETRVASNETHKTSDGSDHSFIDQDVSVAASPIFAGISIPGVGVGSERYGLSALAGGLRSTALGKLASAAGTDGVAVGESAASTGTNSVSVGRASSATKAGATAVGQDADVTGAGGVAVGSNADVGGAGSIAIGENAATSTFLNALAIGEDAVATADNEGQVGTAAKPISIKIYSTFEADDQAGGLIATKGWIRRKMAVRGLLGSGGGWADDGAIGDLPVTLFSNSSAEKAVYTYHVLSDLDLTVNPKVHFLIASTNAPVAGTGDEVAWELTARYIALGEAATKAADETLLTTQTLTTIATDSLQSAIEFTLDATKMSGKHLMLFTLKRLANATNKYAADVASAESLIIYYGNVMRSNSTV